MHADKAITLCQTAVWEASTVTTVAGSASGLSGSTADMLRLPWAVFVDNTSAVYVSDWENNRVQKWLANASNGTTVAGGSPGKALNQLTDPRGISVDANGSVYVVDSINARVMKWASNSAAGANGTIVAGGNGTGSEGNQLNNPDGLFVEAATGVIWIADTNNHRIVKWSSPSASPVSTLHGYWNTTGVTVASGYGLGASQLNYPWDVAIDSNNYIYVADYNNCRIQRWLVGNATGVTVAGNTSFCGSTEAQLSRPTSVVVQSSGVLYISDFGNSRIQRWTNGASSGTTVATNIVSYGVYVDNSGTIYASDWNSHQVLRWPNSGGITNVIIAGGNGQGSASHQLSYPR
ncbi:unnamed protein product, partial [Rotaria sp. Silwood1]